MLQKLFLLFTLRQKSSIFNSWNARIYWVHAKSFQSYQIPIHSSSIDTNSTIESIITRVSEINSLTFRFRNVKWLCSCNEYVETPTRTSFNWYTYREILISTEVNLLILWGESQLEQSYNLDCEPVYQLKVKLALGFGCNRLFSTMNNIFAHNNLLYHNNICDSDIFFFARGHFESYNVNYRLFIKWITMENNTS